jgi:FixJ family two-component response regulator
LFVRNTFNTTNQSEIEPVLSPAHASGKAVEMRAPNEIYVVDDDVVVRDAIKSILKSAGYSFVAFSDGDSLLEAARRRQPMCILLDLVIPGKTGMEVIEALRPLEYPAPVLVISGQATIAQAVTVLKAGAFDFIEKPFTKKHLLERIEAAIESRLPQRRFQVRSDGPNVPLTVREVEVLEWLQKGTTSKVIAKALKVSSRTVEYHRANLLRKFGVRNAARLLQVVLSAQVSDRRTPRGRRGSMGQLKSARAPNEESVSS